MTPELRTQLKALMLDVRNCEDSPYFKTLMSLRQIAAELEAACPELKCEEDTHHKMCSLKLSRVKGGNLVSKYFLKFDMFENFPMTFELAGRPYTCESVPDFEAKVIEAMRSPECQKLLRVMIFT